MSTFATRERNQAAHTPRLFIQRSTANHACRQCKRATGSHESDDELLRRKSATAVQSLGGVPSIVNDVLRSPGHTLDLGTRTLMESRFGRDFSAVRVHTDARAAESAQSVNALAYSVGQDIVFGERQYATETHAGRRLLAHELAHVSQQRLPVSSPHEVSQPNDPLEVAADATADQVMRSDAVCEHGPASARADGKLFRRVAQRLENCVAGTNGVPADPLAALTAVDTQAGNMANLVSVLLSMEAAFTNAGLANPASSVRQAYQNRFGLPQARPGGFINRLTGRVVPSQNQALADEMNLMSRRFAMIATMFSQFIIYRCIGGATTFAGCAIPDCNAFAWSCAGKGVIFLCPMFWGQGDQQKAGILIHEALHINLSRVGDAALAGPGGNFRMAECYASFVADLMGFASPVAPCPAPPA